MRRSKRRSKRFRRVATSAQAVPVTRTNSPIFNLRVPLYRQASQFTCGPACLMMAMKYFQPSLRLTRELEFDIWREANLVESYGTSKEGLALAAARRGFDVYTLGKALRHSFVDTLSDKISGIDYRTLELLYQDTLRKFRAFGLRNLNQPIDLNNLRNALKKHQVPILLTDTTLFGEKEPLPHWIVLKGYAKGGWYVNNPLAESSSTRVKEVDLRDHIGFRGVKCALLVRGLRRERVFS